MHRDLVIRDKFRAKKGLYADGDSIVNGDLTVIGRLQADDFQIDISTIDVISINPHESLVDNDHFYGAVQYTITDPISITGSIAIDGEFLKVPTGPEIDRLPADATFVPDGAIRYNTTANRFEGVVNNSWTGLGGVVDIDQDTYITAEESDDDDTLRMYVSGDEIVSVQNHLLSAYVDTVVLDSINLHVSGDQMLAGSIFVDGDIVNEEYDSLYTTVNTNSADWELSVLYEPADTDGGVQTIRSVTQQEYDSLTPDGNTLYVVRDSESSVVTLPTTFEDDVHIKGNLRVDGNTYLSGGTGGVINVGDNENDIVTFTADVDSDIIPNQNMTFDLGSDVKHWMNVFTHNLSAHGDVNIENQLHVKGDVQIDTNVISDLIPGTDVTFDLGSELLRWRNIHTLTLSAEEIQTDTLSADGDVRIKGNLIVDGEIEGVNKGGSTGGAGEFEDLHVKGDLTVDGNVWFNATNVDAANTIFLGDENTDDIVLNASIRSDVVPSVASTYRLGNTTNPWSQIHVDEIYIGGSPLADLSLFGDGTFTGLTDTPDTFFSHGGRFIKVNDTGTALVFADAELDFDITTTELYNIVSVNSADWNAVTLSYLESVTGADGLYIDTVGDGAETTYTVTHDLSSDSIFYNVRDIVTGQYVDVTATAISDTQLQIDLTSTASVDQYEVTVFAPSGRGGSEGVTTSLQINDFYNATTDHGYFKSLDVTTNVTISGNLSVEGDVFFAGDGSGLVVLGDEETDLIVCNAPISSTSDLYVDGNVLFRGDNDGIILLGDGPQDTIMFAGVLSGDVAVSDDVTIGTYTDPASAIYVSTLSAELVQSDIEYTPGEASDWSSPAPSTVIEAIDRLAAAVKALNGGTGA